MPRTNRVTPAGAIVAVPERGMFLGNRGVLHDSQGRIKRPWQVRRWIVCELEFRGRRRAVMTPDRYTELFFLDEATALAAGHRPCFECRRARFQAFLEAWPHAIEGPSRADAVDAVLHAERVSPNRSKRTHDADLDDLPDGAFVLLQDDVPRLVLGDSLLAWTPGGYGERTPRPRGARVMLLTPPSTVAAIRAGYEPVLHPSAGRGFRTLPPR